MAWRIAALVGFTYFVCSVDAQVGGVAINAEGVLSLKPVSSRASLARVRNAAKELEGDLAQPTDLRFISLKRVLAAEADRTRGTLAGLTRVEYLVADPDSGDILIAGPAEPFGPDASGRLVGAESGRPIVPFAALVEALVHTGKTIGCSIEPDPARQQALNDYLRNNSSPATPSQVMARYRRMAQILGHQTVRVFGVPASSSIGLWVVEADYLLKQIAIGNRPSGVRGVKSQLAHLKVNGNSFQRWWFAPQYEAIATDDDRLVFQLSGPRLKLLAQDEIMGPNGVRIDAAMTTETTQVFARTVSANIDDLARVHPSVANLQNITDCIMIAELIRSESLDATTGFDPFAAAKQIELPTNDWVEPTSVPSAAMTKRAGRYILGLVGGVVLSGPEMVRQFAPAVTADLATSPPTISDGQYWSNGN